MELQGAGGQPLAGFKLEDGGEIYGDETACALCSPDLARLAGRPVRLRVALRDADLLAIRFSG